MKAAPDYIRAMLQYLKSKPFTTDQATAKTVVNAPSGILDPLILSLSLSKAGEFPVYP